jgi:two-component system, chemotaxis family, sensor kinase CheA
VNIEEALPGFVAEASDLLREMESALLECSGGTADAEKINLIFRSAHTIKGSAGLFGLDPIVSFVHVVETALDQVRLGHVAMTEELVTLLLSCKDHIEALLLPVGTGGVPDVSLEGRGAELHAALHEIAAPAGGAAARSEAGGSRKSKAPTVTGPENWRVSVRFGAGVLAAGMDPLGFIRYLQTFCEIRALKVLDDQLPPPAAMDPEVCYLGFEMELRTASGKATIESAFEFVREDCTLTVTPIIDATAPSVVAAPGGAPAEAAKKQATSGEGAAAAASIRVDAAKLDHLITSIGELITAAAGTNLLARRSGSTDLVESASTLSSLVEQVREGALQLRMVKIGATFSRFQRTVRDVSRELGKEIQLIVHGEDTELDKTVVERIADPLTHLVRNSMDHGIEPADVRLARGKPALGTVTLNAYHDSGSVVIEVSDDGGGLKRDKILAKAMQRGLVEEGRSLTDSEVFAFIFEAGFSTAEKVTNLSGRGVGMDVVKRNINALRGNVGISSEEGHGTTVTVRLPLTLAIINGFQVAVGKSSFVLPLDSIEECVEFSSEGNHSFANLRGSVLPFIRLRDVFGTREPPSRRQSIVVVKHAGERTGLVVDALLGEFQTVIKPLGKLFRKADCVSGSSILGNGEVALILDVPTLVQQARAQEQQREAVAANA